MLTNVTKAAGLVAMLPLAPPIATRKFPIHCEVSVIYSYEVYLFAH